MEQPVLQSSLGAVANNSNSVERTWNNGTLALCKVLKVHHKRYTADVIVLGTSNVIRSSNDNEGKHSCRIGVSNAGFDTTFQKPFGEIVPIQEGAIVLVAFMNNKRERPVILRVCHDIGEDIGQDNAENILSTQFMNTTKLSEVDTRRYLNILRSQDFITIDGLGNFEIASHTKAFLVGKYSQEIDPENFGYEELSVKDRNKNTVGLPPSESKPMKLVAAFQSAYDSLTCNWIRFIVDAAKSVFKVAKQQRSEQKLSLLEIAENGAIRIRRQQDSAVFYEGQDYTELTIQDDGKIVIERCKGSNKTANKTILTLGGDETSLKSVTEDSITMLTLDGDNAVLKRTSGDLITTLQMDDKGLNVKRDGEKAMTTLKLDDDGFNVKRDGEKATTLKITDSEVRVITDNPVKYESKELVELNVEGSNLKVTPDGVFANGVRLDV